MKFKYEVMSVDTAAKSMEVKFSAEGEADVTIAMPVPVENEDFNGHILSHSPVPHWQRKAASVQSVPVGKTADLWTEHLGETPEEFAARTASDSSDDSLGA
jgi:hypothetical protein